MATEEATEEEALVVVEEVVVTEDDIAEVTRGTNVLIMDEEVTME